MLERSQVSDIHEPPPPDLHILDLDRLFGVLARQWRVLAICVTIGLLLGVIYLVLAPRSYFSYSQILIDENLQQVIDDLSSQTTTTTIESRVLNQIEVLRSSRIATAVVIAEKLDTDIEFLNPPPSFMGQIRNLIMSPFGSTRQQLNAISVETAAKIVMSSVAVERVGRSSVLNVGYSSHTPALALRIANAYAEAFLRDQLDADLDASKEATNWLQQRLAELGESQRQAALAVEQFRRDSGHTVAQDQTLSDQRLQALTSQLVVAQSETARARALSSQLRTAIAAGPQAAAANSTLLTGTGLDEPRIAALVARYSDIVQRLDEVIITYGADHPQAAALVRDRGAAETQIFAQLQLLNDRYTNELQIAEGREAALREDVEEEGQLSAQANQSQVQLNELQQRSTALGVLYNSFLSRYEETLQRQSFPIPTVRTITPASMPGGPSSPRTTFTLAGAGLLGVMLGLCFGAVNELRERSFRVGTQISRDLGLRFIGYLPDLALGRARRRKPFRGNPIDMHRVIRRQVLDAQPNATVGAFSETLKAGKNLLQSRAHAGRAPIMGVVSMLPGEGKTTFAVAFSEMLAARGSSVLIVDADFRHPGTTRLLAPQAERGLLEVTSSLNWRDAVQAVEDVPGLSVIPAGGPDFDRAGSDPLASPALRAFLKEARETFDFVIVDLPPLGPMVDAMTVLPMTDGAVLVAEWGRTPRRLVSSLLEREPQLSSLLIGVVLNKVNFGRLARYSRPGDSERYFGAYDRYYQATPIPR